MPRHASGSSRSSRRCTWAGPTAEACGSAATARTELYGGFDRVTALVEVDPAGASSDGSRGEPAIVRRYRHEPSPLVRDASGMRTGRIDRVLAGDFDLLVDARTD